MLQDEEVTPKVMERSRSEHHQRIKKQRNRRKNRTLLALSAAAGFCVAGVWIWWQNGPAEGRSGEPAAVSSISARSGASEEAATTPSAAASSTPSASVSPTAAPAASAAPSQPVIAPSVSPELPGNGLKLAFVGDVIFASTVETVLKKNGYDYPYRDLLSELQKPDITAANLETPVTQRGDEQKKEYTYRSRPEALKPFKEAGFDVVTLANNHIMDYGAEGMLDTFKYLDQEGILRTGAGKDLKEAYKPVIMEKNGIKIAYLGFSHKIPNESWKAGINKPGTTQLYDIRQALEAIANAKKEADLVVVMPHWGEERQDKPLEAHRAMAKKFIDAGADLIVGSHPHVLQGFETYKGKWIVYSLGNFLFTTNTVSATWDSAILNAECTKAGDCSLAVVPVLTKFARPARMGAAEGAALFKRLSSISFGAKVDGEGRIAASGAESR